MGKSEITYEEVDGFTPEEVRQDEVYDIKGFQDITCHIVFDVNMDFTRKARYVANGATTDTPVGLFYLSVVSCDSVVISFLVPALNDIDIWHVKFLTHILMLRSNREFGLLQGR